MMQSGVMCTNMYVVSRTSLSRDILVFLEQRSSLRLAQPKAMKQSYPGAQIALACIFRLIV
jgi:hypothetical protein